MNIHYYFDRLNRELHMRRFNKAVPAVLESPVVPLQQSGVCVVSMVNHRDVLSYLLALKSFASKVAVARVVLVADPTLNEQDKAVLSSHVPNLTLRPVTDFQLPGLPVGGCWERLVAVIQHAADAFVVQLDADTVAYGAMSHVNTNIGANRSFTLGTYDLQGPVSVGEVSRWAASHVQTHKNPHIQLVCESKLAQAVPSKQVYIRGCAGFTGWSAGCASVDDLVSFSEHMRALVGEGWDRWGTEQFASNYMVSNAPNAMVLPHPVYTTPDLINHTTEFVHFIGPLRYSKGIYLQKLQQFLQERGVSV